MNKPRIFFSVIAVEKYLYVIGGGSKDGPNDEYKILSSCEKYDIK